MGDRMDGIYTLAGLEDKSVLWSKYHNLVRQEALRLQKRLPACVEFDDLIQAGALGFISAIESFDAKKGVSLSAWIIQRVRWSLIDELRERDWVPRRVRTHSREVAAVIRSIEQEKGGVATEADIAERMGVSLKAFQQMLADNNTSQMYSLDELQEKYVDHWEHASDEAQLLDPIHASLKNNLVQCISEHMCLMPEREQRILQFYYQCDMNMKEIALVLGITETRVSQLHSLAIKRLRSRMDCGRAVVK